MAYTSHSIIKQDKAEVGTGTLILFIATIIIATVAFGALMASTSVLQTSMEITAKESKQKLTTAVYLDDVVGWRSKNNDTGTLSDSIQRIDLYVSVSAASQPIDMSQTKVVVLASTKSVIFGYNAEVEQTKADNVYFIMESMQDSDGSMNGTVPVMNYGDIVRIVVSTADNRYCTDNTLADVDLCSPVGFVVEPYDAISIELVPEKGIGNFVSFSAPATLGSSQYIMLKEE